MDLSLDANVTPEALHFITNHPDVEVMFVGGPPPVSAIKRAMSKPDTAAALVKDDMLIVGFLVVKHMNIGIVKLSGGFINGYRGKAAKDVVARLIDLLFKNGTIKIVGEVLPDNRQCLQMAYALGFRREGVNRASVIQGNRLVDQIYVGLTLGDWKNGSGIRQLG